MKRVFFVLFVLCACSKESSVGPGNASTFVRYFNGGSNDEAQALIENKGFVMLATTEVVSGGLAGSHFKIKLIKTDSYGNQLWQKLYPEFGNDNVGGAGTAKKSYIGRGIAINPTGGYVIVGEDIQNGRSQLLILTVDDNGTKLMEKTMTYHTAQRKGFGVAANAAGNFMVTSSIPDTTAAAGVNMMLGEYSKTDLSPKWTRAYGSGETLNLSNKLFLDGDGTAYWGGSVKKVNNPALVRFVKTPPNSLTTVFDNTYGSLGFKLTSNDLVRYGSGFALVGKSDLKVDATTGAETKGDFNILYKRITDAGTELTAPALQTFPVKDQDGGAEGNSLCVAQDGGVVLLGSAKLTGASGRGETDYILIKIDAFGNPLWTQTYGSKFEDVGKSIITTADGGHVILGTTNLANVKTLMLMKTDKNGKIE